MTMPPPGPMPRQGGMGGGMPMGRAPQPFVEAASMEQQSQFPPRFMAIMEQLPPELAQQIIMSLQPDTQDQGFAGQGAMPPRGMVS